jgi:redox-sensing transcriptional repressor
MSDKPALASPNPFGLPPAPNSASHSPPPYVRRLSLYLRMLEQLSDKGVTTLSSKQLGDQLGLTDGQVRKDLAHFGQFGHPGVGYRPVELIRQIRHILGIDRPWNVILIGAGNLGKALASHKGFAGRNMHLKAVLDADPQRLGEDVSGIKVEPMHHLQDVVMNTKAQLAIIAVPAGAAQTVCDSLVRAGIKAILNFAPRLLAVPADVSVNNVDLAQYLEQLAFQLHLSKEANPGG